MVRDDGLSWKRSIARGVTWGGCLACRHFRPDVTCVAYPDRIPLLIASGEVDHLRPRPGQVGETAFEIEEHPVGLARRAVVKRARGDTAPVIAELTVDGRGTIRALANRSSQSIS